MELAFILIFFNTWNWWFFDSDFLNYAELAIS